MSGSTRAAQDYTATLLTYTISGNTGVGGVTLSYTDGTDKLVNSDSTGAYSFPVSYNWTGTVTPSKTGYTFLPVSRNYTNVLANWPAQNYTATPILFTITGNAGVAGAILSYMDGTLKTVTADPTGAYTISVLYNWSGTVTPSLPGYSFTPANRVYSPVFANQTAQDYVATLSPFTIAGNAGVAGAILTYTDGSVKTTTADAFGNYAIAVSSGWTGTVTPALTGYTFLPTSLSYTNLLVSQTSQNYVATANTYTVTGNAGMAGATLSFVQGTPQTATADSLGNYTFTIAYSSVPVVVTPSLTGYTFMPVTKTYTNVLADQTAQDYIASPVTYTITGNAGVAGATMTYTGGSTVADGSGVYTITVPFTWTGTVTPSLPGYTFAPVNTVYPAPLTGNLAAQDYTATPILFTISGNAGVSGAALSYTDGTPKTATSDGLGNYSFTVSYNWSGTVTPGLAGYTFSPPNRPYTNVLADQTLQNYTATPNFFTISGNTGIPGVTLSYSDGTPKTATSDAAGNYSFAIQFSSLPVTVTPSMAGFTFLPVNRTYSSVVADQPAQDYTPTAITYTITGNTGVPGVTLSYTDGTPKTATSDGSGNYSFTVSYNWSGTVTPSLLGYAFVPGSRSYLNVLADQTVQDYTAIFLYYQYMPVMDKN